MAQVLSIVPTAGLEAVLVAVELALEGAPCHRQTECALAEWIPTFVPSEDLPVDGVWALDAEFCKSAAGEGPAEPALFVWLPHLDERQLRAVASTAMGGINVQSEDLLYCES
jgi:hypothetical protein